MDKNERFFVRKMKETGITLNTVQKQAVLRTEGPLLLLASPGSGKTSTIIMRIGFLLEEKGVDPSRIKAVTFSRASANDMKERFERLFPVRPSGGGANFSTIHSLAFEMMREHFRRTGTAYQIIEGEVDADAEQESLPGSLPLHKKLILRDLYRRIAGETITDDQMDELTSYISFVKNKGLPPERWSEIKCDVPQAVRVLQDYETFKRSAADKLLIDFDDMLTIANDALAKDEELKRRFQRRYDYVLTDESQDTSLVQHAIIAKLVEAHGNLCVVADDDQSIYTWRAAEPQYLLDFKRIYPAAVILKMEQNYRSSKNVVDVANRFIKRNKNRYDKNMFTENPLHKPIVLNTLTDYSEQARYLVERVSALDDLREAAVLYRNNSSSISLMNAFDRAGIPFYMKDGDNRFFSHWVVEDMLNFMRMTYTDKRADIFEKIHMKCSGYITKKQMAALKEIDNEESVFDNLLRFVPLQDYQLKLLPEVKETFESMKGGAPLAVIRTVRQKLGYEKAIEKMCERLGFRKEYLLGILNTLEEIADSLETMEDFAKRLNHLASALKTSRFNKHANAVTLSTFHSTKGLEFEHVFMIDLIDGVIPSSEDIKKLEDGDRDDMEEAVRLFYVGMTRAKTHLELLSYTMRDGAKVRESRFMTNVRHIQDPPQVKPSASSKQSMRASDNRRGESGQTKGSGTAVPRVSKTAKPKAAYNPNAIRHRSRLTPGAAVTHRAFGRGEVAKLDGDFAHIRFKTGLKILSIEACIELGVLEPAADH
ncbi:ATP-dependent helicase [Paenibacillus contaminans]|uniref:DNA 3'-5' helicase n=1 Tax=Paenibacillus contaminans TaxID=450362 RepID=A0A329M9V8_9BACL|nr:ATP-dependent helicase [Paenibacillus contaminans]RAV15333.1 ATP-dependent helicase [Paenibacillus contaminans]